MHSCRSFQSSLLFLIQIIPSGFHSNFPCQILFFHILSPYLHPRQSQGFFPNSFKIAQVSPLLKKIGLDKDNPSNYKQISYLNNISKLLERLILIRIQDHTIYSTNLNPFQSAYRRFRSTKTSLLLTLDRIFHSIDQGSSTVLISLDLNAAFNTIDHLILLNRLDTFYDIHGVALSWFASYLSNRCQFVSIGNSKSTFFLHPPAFPKVLYSDPSFSPSTFHPLQRSHLPIILRNNSMLMTRSYA